MSAVRVNQTWSSVEKPQSLEVTGAGRTLTRAQALNVERDLFEDEIVQSAAISHKVLTPRSVQRTPISVLQMGADLVQLKTM